MPLLAPTGAPAAAAQPDSVANQAPAAAAAQPASQPSNQQPTGGEANPWDHIDEYSADPSLAAQTDLTMQDQPGQQPAATDPNQQQPVQTAASPAGALNSDTAAAPASDGTNQPQAPAAPGPVPYERFKEVDGKLANMSQMAEFYQRAYNELVAQQQGVQPPAGAPQEQPGAQPAPGQPAPASNQPMKLPPGIKGPGEWESQDEMAAYHEHVASTRAQSTAEKIVNEQLGNARKAVDQQFQTLSKYAGAIEDMVVRSMHPDFDDVVKPVMAELFVTDHEGKVWTDQAGVPKVKNPALLKWIQQSPMPRKALYDFALSKRAPEKITEAVQNNTRQILQQLDTRPKGPTQPRQSGGQPPSGGLDWNTPTEEADKILQSRGIL